MKTEVHVGDVLDAPADILICSANPWLNMSGGVNGAVRERSPEIQEELRRYLQSRAAKAIPAGSVVQTSAGNLPFGSIIHAVAIDPFYDSSEELVAATLRAAFELARSLAAASISVPALATGYGPLSIQSFARAFVLSRRDHMGIKLVKIVGQDRESKAIIENVLDGPESH